MTTGRLTRQELGWLLAQEARGAAKILRQDVALRSQPPPADPVSNTPGGEHRVEITLNALDDAIGMLSELDSPPGSRPSTRRGRIDLAGLLIEFTPTASITIEPGSGTEVFGEENELRRMLHVLASQATFAGSSHDESTPPVRLRREGDVIRITVNLGPDASASADMERRWLSRMATRMGGRVELEGGTLSLLLPADGTAGEVEGLRRELEQAQQLGEAYARELATAFGEVHPQAARVVTDPRTVAVRRFEMLVSLASAIHRPLAGLVNSVDGDDSEASSRTATLADGQALLAELGRVATCSLDADQELNLSRCVRNAVEEAGGRLERAGVRVILDVPEGLVKRVKTKAAALLIHSLLDHAIAATPREGNITVSLRNAESRTVFTLTDGGPVVPEGAREGLLEHRVDPASLGRPPGIGLLVAHTTAAYLGGALRIGESSNGAALAEATF